MHARAEQGIKSRTEEKAKVKTSKDLNYQNLAPWPHIIQQDFWFINVPDQNYSSIYARVRDNPNIQGAARNFEFFWTKDCF